MDFKRWARVETACLPFRDVGKLGIGKFGIGKLGQGKFGFGKFRGQFTDTELALYTQARNSPGLRKPSLLIPNLPIPSLPTNRL